MFSINKIKFCIIVERVISLVSWWFSYMLGNNFYIFSHWSLRKFSSPKQPPPVTTTDSLMLSYLRAWNAIWVY